MSAVTLQRGVAAGLAYSAAGQGPAIVLLHPIGMDGSWWLPYLQHWAGRYRVVAFDMPGHGASAAITASMSLADHARAVLEAMDVLGVAGAAVVGVSMGGMVAQCMAIAAPHRVRGLVLCATAGGFPESARAAIRARGDTSRAGDMAEVVDATLARWFTPDSPPELVATCRERLLADDWHSWSASWAAISALNNLAELSALKVPALVIAGDRDASMPVTVCRQLADALQAECAVIANSAHFGAFDTPERFWPVIDPFLARLPG